MQRKRFGHFAGFAVALLGAQIAHATEGALGRPISGTSVVPNAGVVPPEPVWAINIGEVYVDDSIGRGRKVPVMATATLIF